MTQWGRGQWATVGNLKATIAQTVSRGGKWIFQGSITCPSTGILGMAEWDVDGNIKKIAGILTTDKDFNLTKKPYKEGE